MDLLKLQQDIIYGPVNSRRLRKSLGINLLPVNLKVCPFDCIYCHYGRTHIKTISADNALFPGEDLITQKIENALNTHRDINCITFSGNGEPTLHPRFLGIVEQTIEIRNKFNPNIPIAILTNSSTMENAEIRRVLERLDICIAKLDAGNTETFAKVNRPCSYVSFEGIVTSLREARNIIIQCVMIDGEFQNIRSKPLDDWIECIAKIRPKEVQIYTTDRPVAEKTVKKVSKSVLEDIALTVENQTKVKVRAY